MDAGPPASIDAGPETDAGAEADAGGTGASDAGPVGEMDAGPPEMTASCSCRAAGRSRSTPLSAALLFALIVGARLRRR